MQKLNCTELGEKLSNSLDDENRIKDLGVVQDIFTTLERANITKEVLEKSRLGRHVNEFRRKTKEEALAKRAKDLVRRWRDLLLPQSASQNSNIRISQTQVPSPSTATGATTIPMAISTTAQTLSSSISRSSSFKPHSPATGIITKPPQSPANFAMTRNHMPHSPLLRDATSLPYKALSPALSTLHSNRSRSPNLSSITKPLLPPPSPSLQQQSTNYPVNHQLNSSSSPILLSTGTNQHHNLEAVPRTHSSNKRLRKEDTTTTLNQQQQAQNSKESLGTPLRDDQPLFKKQRINGENINSNINPNTNITNINKINSQVPSPLSTPKFIHNNDGGGGNNNNIVVVATSTTSVVIPPPPTATVDVGPKKRGRKKGSKVIKNQLQPDVGVGVKEKLQSMSRDSKCKTTQELMEDLKAARGSSTKLSIDYTLSNVKIKNEPPTTKEILRNSSSNDVKYNSSGRTTKTTHRLSSKLTKSSGDDDDDDDDDDEDEDDDNNNNNNSNNNKINNDGGKKNNSLSKNTTQFRHDPTVEEILAKLPPLDLNSIIWSDNELDDDHDNDDDDDDDPLPPPRPPPTDEEIERLHEYSIECLNGNFQTRLDSLSNNVDKKMDKNGDGLTSCHQIMKYPLFRKRNNKNSNSNNNDVDDVGDGDDDVDKFDKNNHYEFREWHEMLARPTIDGQILHILPYVIID